MNIILISDHNQVRLSYTIKRYRLSQT